MPPASSPPASPPVSSPPQARRAAIGSALLAVLALLALLGAARCAPPKSPPPPPRPARYALVPVPLRLEPRAGEFRLDGATRIVLADTANAELRTVAELFAVPVRAASGLPLPVAIGSGDDAPDAITLRLTTSAAAAAPDSAHSERYHLVVTPRGVVVSAATPAGLFYGLQTLRQLLPPDVERGLRSTSVWDSSGTRLLSAAPPKTAVRWTVPAVEIDDAPRFGYRGILIDVGRHYFAPEFLKRLVDYLALYKFNRLQLHLTDDQGWRLEIRKYPRLTQVGAWRRETQVADDTQPYVGDGKPHGGFYTQAQIRDLVAYAAARHVTIVPEIEMPGHSGAAIAAYPELACTPGPFEVSTTWGVKEDVFCPTERTIAFLEDVLTEVMELFPSEYIHIGGDEVPKTRWKASPVAQEIMRREGLKDEQELQSWFTRRIERFVSAHGRRLIGWDEILDGGIAPEATVMSWRGMEGGIAAARQGHDVIMSPDGAAYLDHYQGDPATEPLAHCCLLPLDSVYAWQPVPAELTPAEASHVIGVQGNLWTEYIATPSHAEYMLFPRMLAVAEVAWSPKESRDRERFLASLPAQFARLDALGANYRVPTPVGLGGDHRVLGRHVRVVTGPPVAGAVVRYTTDGSEPTASSPRYTGPIDLRVSQTPTVVTARTFLLDGRASPIVRASYARAAWTKAFDISATDALRSRRAFAGGSNAP